MQGRIGRQRQAFGDFIKPGGEERGSLIPSDKWLLKAAKNPKAPELDR